MITFGQVPLLFLVARVRRLDLARPGGRPLLSYRGRYHPWPAAVPHRATQTTLPGCAG